MISLPHIRLPLGQFCLFRQALELAPAHIRQISSVLCRGGVLIIIDAHAGLGPDALGCLTGISHRLGGIHAPQGNKGNHIHRAHAGMLAPVNTQIDALGGHFRQTHRRLHHGLRRAQEGQHRAIVVFVGRIVHQSHTGHAPHSVTAGLHHGRIAAL